MDIRNDRTLGALQPFSGQEAQGNEPATSSAPRAPARLPEPLPDYPGGIPAPDYEVVCEPIPSQLASVANLLRKMVAQHARGDSPGITAVKSRLAEELRKIENISWRTEADGALFSTQGQQEIVDAFRSASKHANEISKAYDRNGKHHQAMQYNLYCALLIELKRFHLSHNAPNLMKEGAAREIGFLVPQNVGVELKANAAGSQLSTLKGIAVDIGPNASGGLGNLSITLGFKGETRKTFLIDDDHDTNVMKLRTGGVRALLQAALSVFRASAEVAPSAAIGDFIETSSIETALQIELNKRANSAARNSLNPMSRSAAPRAQSVYLKVRWAENAIARPFGLSGHDPQAPLYLNDGKIYKGAFNQAELSRIANAIDRLHASEHVPVSLENAIRRAYQPVAEFLQNELDQQQTDGRELELPRNVIFEAIPVSAPSVASALQKASPVRAPWKHHTVEIRGRAGIGYKFGATGLSTGANIGISASEQSRHLAVERLKTTHECLDPNYTKDLKKSVELLDKIRCSFGNNHPIFHLSARRGYEGVEYDLRMDSLREQIYTLHQKYIRFLHHAHDALTRIRKQKVTEMHRGTQHTHDTSLEAINKLVWNGQYDPISMKRNSEEFVSRSYDAFSLALAELGIKLAEAKEGAAHIAASAAAADAVRRASQAVDQAYLGARGVLDATLLPLKQEYLLRHTVLQHSAASTKVTISGGLNVSANFNLNPTATTSVGVLAHDFFQIEGVGTAAWSAVAQHPNSVRRGNFLELTLSCGTSATANIIRNALMKLLDKCADHGVMTKGEAAAVLTALALDAAPITDELRSDTLLIKLRKPPVPNEAKPSSWRLQYVRATTAGRSGFSVKASNVLPSSLAPITFGGGVNATQIATVPKSEMMGNDFGYHILQFPDLKKRVLNSGTQSDVSSASLDHVKAFLAAPGYILKYFSGDGILCIARDFFQLAHGDRKGSGELARFEEGVFLSISEAAACAAHFAPGSGKDIYSFTPINEVEALKAWFREQRFDMELLGRNLKSLQLPRNRMEFMCAARSGGLASVFEAYTRIMETYTALLNAAKNREGYDVTVRSFATQVPLAASRS